MAKKTYRVGLVGATGIAARRPDDAPGPFKNQIVNSHVAALSLLPDVELVAVCDLVPELLDEFKENWGDRWPNTKTYTDSKEMFATENLDLLNVVTTDNRHADITVDGANAGVKGIFCEKPLATNMEDANRMIKACDDNGTILITGYTRRFRRLYHTIRDAVRAGAIGPLATMTGTMGGGLGKLFFHGTHMIDGMCFFAESEPVQVFANLEEGFDDWDVYRGAGGRGDLPDPGVSGFIQFRNGVRGFYNGTKNSFQTNTLKLVGSEGQIYCGFNDQSAKVLTRDPGTGDLVSRTLRPREYQVHGMAAGFQELIDLIENGGTTVSTGRDGRMTVQIMQGFLNSHQAGGRLIDVPE